MDTKTPELEILTTQILEHKSHMSPQLQERIIEKKLEMIDREYTNEWKSCCITADKRSIEFFSKLVILMGFGVFFCVQLARNTSCEHQQLYSSLLTLILGILVPSPNLRGNNLK